MPIRPPALDDRRFDDIVNELLSRIPAHTPEWTNPRTGDPGRTLIDLFAWLGDALLYRVNLIPERQRLAFLRLLGQPVRPARPATGLVTVQLKSGREPVAFRVKPGAKLTGTVPFEVRNEFSVLPLTAAVYYKRKPLSGEVAPSLQQALSALQFKNAPVTPYITTPLFQERKQSAVDVFGESLDRSVWFALLAPKAPSPGEQNAWNLTVLEILNGDETSQQMILNIGVVPGLPFINETDETSSQGGKSVTQKFNIVPNVPAGELPGTGSVRARIPHVWETAISSYGEVVDEEHPWYPRYLTLNEISDTTSGMTRPGVIRLGLPRDIKLFAPSNNLREDRNAGAGDRPPRLDDKTLSTRLVGWIRLRPRQPEKNTSSEQIFTPKGASEHFEIPQIQSGAAVSEVEHFWVTWMGVNAVFAEQYQTQKNLIIGESSGLADQEFSLPADSVEPETLQVFVEEENGWQLWGRVEDLYTIDWEPNVARNARVFQLDPEAGTIRFGDGVRGRIPGVGRRILAGQMRHTNGEKGNLPAGSKFSMSAETLNGENVGPQIIIEQPLVFSGGCDAETLAQAERRIPALFRHRDRAVTAEDYRVLALETPGVAVARVEMLPRFKPQQRFFNIPGVVSVMALPDASIRPAPNPRADRPFLETVHAWLDARRPIGTELYIIGCEYVPVVLSVAISIADGIAADAILQDVKDALVRVLWPLHGGGYDGQGWKLKRSVSNRELAVEVARVQGVSEVNGLNLFQRTLNGNIQSWKAVGDSRNGKEQNVAMQEWQLPELIGVVAVVGNDAALNVDQYFGLSGNSGEGMDGMNAVAAVPSSQSDLQCTCGRQL
jgi:hypothetical protein